MSTVAEQSVAERVVAPWEAAEGPTAQDEGAVVVASPRPEASFPRIYAYLILLGLTLGGGFVRLYWIDRPTCWNDEAHVFRRITGSFQTLLDQLQYDGFGPLHYEVYWAMAHWKTPSAGRLVGGIIHGDLGYDDFFADRAMTMTPFWMRIVPALAGTLMIPAMYFLARQLCSRRTSLLVAAFTACSAFLMVYAHDGKMYMHLWLFCVLSVACLLWWLRTGLRVAWLAWIAASLAVAGTHAPGLLVLGLEPVFMLTSSRFWRRKAPFFEWRKLVAFLAGVAIIVSGPLVHYRMFNRWTDRVDEDWGAAGLGWLPPVLYGRDGPERMLFVASDYICSWEWPSFKYRDPVKPAVATPAAVQSFAANGFSGMLQGYNIDVNVRFALMSVVIIVLAGAAAGVFPWKRRWRGETNDDRPTEAWWRKLFWLSVWLVLPAYGFYAASVPDPENPGRGGRGRRAPVVQQQVERKADRPVYTGPKDWYESGRWFLETSASELPANRVPKFVIAHWFVFSLAGMALLGGLFLISRYIPRLVAAGFVAMVLALGGYAVHDSGIHRLIPGALRVLGAALFDPNELAKPVAALGNWCGVVWLFAWGLVDRLLDPRVVIAAVVVLPPLAWYYSADTVKGRMIRLGQFAGVVGAVLGLCLAVYYVMWKFPPGNTGPVWMSRYVAIVWPAFAIGLCALIARLPFRPLRYTVIAILLGANMVQAWGRMFAGTEPRVDLMMRDVVAADDLNSPVLTYIQPGPETAHPAGGTVENRPGKYFAAVETGRLFKDRSPSYFLGEGRTVELLNLRQIRRYSDPGTVAIEAKRSATANRVIVWDRLIEKPAAPLPDEIMRNLDASWKRVSEEFYPVRYHWNWSSLYVSRRREYVKQVAGAAATPTPAPAVAPVRPATVAPTPVPPAVTPPVRERPAERVRPGDRVRLGDRVRQPDRARPAVVAPATQPVKTVAPVTPAPAAPPKVVAPVVPVPATQPAKVVAPAAQVAKPPVVVAPAPSAATPAQAPVRAAPATRPTTRPIGK